MPIKKRKSLDDALAQEFVYGENGSSGKSKSVEDKEPETVRDSGKLKKQDVETVKSESVSIEAQEIEPVKATKKPQQQKSQPSIMDKLQSVEKLPTKRFTVDLVDPIHRKLSILAAKTGRTKADIVRMLLEDALKDIED